VGIGRILAMIGLALVIGIDPTRRFCVSRMSGFVFQKDSFWPRFVLVLWSGYRACHDPPLRFVAVDSVKGFGEKSEVSLAWGDWSSFADSRGRSLTCKLPGPR
jgi:hypothetical protein